MRLHGKLTLAGLAVAMATLGSSHAAIASDVGRISRGSEPHSYMIRISDQRYGKVVEFFTLPKGIFRPKQIRGTAFRFQIQTQVAAPGDAEASAKKICGFLGRKPSALVLGGKPGSRTRRADFVCQ